jgi:Raf kinase inhibitor-like YbhB/YbcL family protein
MKTRRLVHIPTVCGILFVAAVEVRAGSSVKISSPDIVEGGNIPQKFTCDGANVNPALRFEGVPAGAKSLVVIVDDPDAPGGLFTHWLLWNIGPKTIEIAEGRAPTGLQGKNDFGKSGYGGPCPPSGTHRYYFKVFALDGQLALPAGAKRAQLDDAMRGHVLGEGAVMGRYQRSH